jgi:hypothetical protein
MEVPLATWLVISVWMLGHLLQHPWMIPQWFDMLDWLQTMRTMLKSGSTSLFSLNATFTPPNRSSSWFAPVRGSMLTTFHVLERHSSSLDLHLRPLSVVPDFLFPAGAIFFFPTGRCGNRGSSSSSLSSSPHSSSC